MGPILENRRVVTLRNYTRGHFVTINIVLTPYRRKETRLPEQQRRLPIRPRPLTPPGPRNHPERRR